MTLPTHEFIRRFLLHVLPRGFHRIRHYGLLAGSARKASIVRAREMVAVVPPPEAVEAPGPLDWLPLRIERGGQNSRRPQRCRPGDERRLTQHRKACNVPRDHVATSGAHIDPRSNCTHAASHSWRVAIPQMQPSGSRAHGPRPWQLAAMANLTTVGEPRGPAGACWSCVMATLTPALRNNVYGDSLLRWAYRLGRWACARCTMGRMGRVAVAMVKRCQI